MPIRLACVFFPSEKSKHVIPVTDVLDLPMPRALTDFEANKLYNIRWPVLPNEGSATVEDTFKGQVLLLAASPESMIRQAKSANVRLPPAFLQSHGKSDTDAKTLAQASTMVKRASKKSQKLVLAAMQISCKERMAEMLRVHQTDLKEITDLTPITGLTNNETSIIQEEDKSGENLTTDGGSIKDKDTANANNSSRRSKRMACGKGEKNPRKREKISDSEEDSEDEVTVDNDEDNESSKVTIKKLEEDIVRLSSALTSERKERRKLQTEATSYRLRLCEWEKAFKVFTEKVKNSATSPGPFKLTTTPVNRCSPSWNSTRTPKRSGLDRVKEWVEEAKELSDKKLKPVDASTTIPDSSRSRRQLFTGSADAEQDTASVQEKCKSLERNAAEPASSPLHQGGNDSDMAPHEYQQDDSYNADAGAQTPTKSETGTAQLFNSPLIKHVKQTPSPKKKSSKKSPSEVIRKYTASGLGPNDKTSQQLAPMLLRALNKEEDLMSSGDGRLIIGNGCLVKQSVWKRISSPDIKHSLAVKDLAEELWGSKCREYSLCGGKSPKNPLATSKPAAPAAEVEAIFAFYRARRMREGLLNENYLKEAVTLNAEKYIREKFQDANRRKKETKIKKDQTI